MGKRIRCLSISSQILRLFVLTQAVNVPELLTHRLVAEEVRVLASITDIILDSRGKPHEPKNARLRGRSLSLLFASVSSCLLPTRRTMPPTGSLLARPPAFLPMVRRSWISIWRARGF
jgi:hypothetical protein